MSSSLWATGRRPSVADWGGGMSAGFMTFDIRHYEQIYCDNVAWTGNLIFVNLRQSL